jgi:hypothetical protein
MEVVKYWGMVTSIQYLRTGVLWERRWPLIVKERVCSVAIEAGAAFEGVEFDDEGAAGDGAAEFLDELGCCCGGAASGEEVIDDDDSMAIDGGIAVEFE